MATGALVNALVAVGELAVLAALRASMPVEFLMDDEAAVYGRFTGPPSQADLARVFFLDEEDLALAGDASWEAHQTSGIEPAMRSARSGSVMASVCARTLGVRPSPPSRSMSSRSLLAPVATMRLRLRERDWPEC
jgi:hypothetical protein